MPSSNCPLCLYDLAPTPAARCPECGATEAARRRFVVERKTRYPREAVFAVILAGGISILFMVFALPFALPDVGLPFGYYGELNRTRRDLERIPGATVVFRGANYDVTVEEFGFDVVLPSGTTVSVFVPDHTNYASASHVVIRSVEQVNLGTRPPHPDYSGLTFDLSSSSSLVQILGSPTLTIANVVSNADKIAAYVDGTPLPTLRERHEPNAEPPGSILLQITRGRK